MMTPSSTKERSYYVSMKKALQTLPFITLLVSLSCQEQPNIVYILADDLGWDDVSFHGTHQIYTPNIDALAMDGIILNQLYVEPLCTPSRAALMTGRQASHVGLQHKVIYGQTPYGLPLDIKILPQYMKDLNYSTHLVGKWNLGSFKKEYWPTHRGFETYLGYNQLENDYYDHSHCHDSCGLDFWDNETLVALEYLGNYSTDIFRDRARSIIRSESVKKNPFFILLSFQAVHTGHDYAPYQAPREIIRKFGYIERHDRRVFAAMLSSMDDAIGAVVKELEDTHQLNNTIIVFTTDNGGQSSRTSVLFEEGASSNWPLRGTKATFWEGGVRGTGFVWSPLLEKSGYTDKHLMHISDWLPTLYAAGGGNPKDLPNSLDGINYWNLLKNGEDATLREELVLQFDGDARSYRYRNFKLVTGPSAGGSSMDRWYKPSGRDAEVTNSSSCLVDDILKRLENRKSRNYAAIQSIKCRGGPPAELNCNSSKDPCLFDIESDPCEYQNIAMGHSEIVQLILSKLNDYSKTVVPALNKPYDPSCFPEVHGYVWRPCM